jgi:hypothetical protein
MATGIFIDFLLIMVFLNILFAGCLFILRYIERSEYKRR